MLTFRSVVRDCLYVNWAVPLAALPALPGPLTYETRTAAEGEVGFVSTVLFRQHTLRLGGLPIPTFSYPQFNLRVYVRDADDRPAVYFLRMYVPGWVVPGARLVGGQPALPARFEYPARFAPQDAAGAQWRVVAQREFRVAAVPSEPAIASGDASAVLFLSWDVMAKFFRERSRGYVGTLTGLNRIATQPATTQIVPMRVREVDSSLADVALGRPLGAAMSAFLAPSTPFVFELATLPALPAGSTLVPSGAAPPTT
jgi:hypothetical protein